MATNKKGPIEAQELITEDLGTVAFDNGQKIDDDADTEIEIESNVLEASGRAAALAFYEEEVMIQISEDTNPLAPETHVFLSVNGRGAGPGGIPWVPRGIPVTVKRMYVERLARARTTNYGNVERVNAQGDKEYVYPKTSALKYPFTVLQDNNPKGPSWLRALLSER